MKIINTAFIALAVLSASATGALARDGIPSRTETQYGMDSYDLNNDQADNNGTWVQVVRPRTHVNGGAREIIRQNAREPK